MLILVCISEDQYANSLLHDSNILYSVSLYQAVGESCQVKLNFSYIKETNLYAKKETAAS